MILVKISSVDELSSLSLGAARVWIADDRATEIDVGQIASGVTQVVFKNCIGLRTLKGQFPDSVKECVIKNTMNITSFDELVFPSSFDSLRFLPSGPAEYGENQARFLCNNLIERHSRDSSPIPNNIFIGDWRIR